MKKLILFYLPDCNVSKLFEERLHKALALPEFAGRFNLIRYNLYTDTGRQSDYTFRRYLRKLLE